MRFAQTARRGIFAGLVVGALSAAPASAFFWDQNVADQFGHFVDCAGLLISDPAAHAAQCGPGLAPPAFTHVTGNGHYEPKPVDDDDECEEPDISSYRSSSSCEVDEEIPV